MHIKIECIGSKIGISREIRTSKICIEYDNDALIVSDYWGTKYIYPAKIIKDIKIISNAKS